MKLELTPLLHVQRELYRVARGFERFRAYLQTMTGGTDDLVLPLVALNPMGQGGGQRDGGRADRPRGGRGGRGRARRGRAAAGAAGRRAPGRPGRGRRRSGRLDQPLPERGEPPVREPLRGEARLGHRALLDERALVAGDGAGRDARGRLPGALRSPSWLAPDAPADDGPGGLGGRLRRALRRRRGHLGRLPAARAPAAGGVRGCARRRAAERPRTGAGTARDDRSGRRDDSAPVGGTEGQASRRKGL